MNCEQAKQKFKKLVNYYNSLHELAQRTGGDTELLWKYRMLRDRSWQAVVGGAVNSFNIHKSDKELVKQFDEKALRIFQA
jgi:hypothetical protein